MRSRAAGEGGGVGVAPTGRKPSPSVTTAEVQGQLFGPALEKSRGSGVGGTPAR